MNNHFINSPTVGSNDCNSSTYDDLQARIRQLEQRLAMAEEQKRSKESKRKKIKWGKMRKFFDTVVKPILEFIPRFINAVARFKEVSPA